MRLTSILLDKSKAKVIMVLLRSTGSSHQIRSFRLKNDEKKEIIFFDPYIEMECVYKEERKIRSMKHPIKISKTLNEDTYGIIPKELLEYEAATKATTQTSKSKNKTPKSQLSS